MNACQGTARTTYSSNTLTTHYNALKYLRDRKYAASDPEVCQVSAGQESFGAEARLADAELDVARLETQVRMRSATLERSARTPGRPVEDRCPRGRNYLERQVQRLAVELHFDVPNQRTVSMRYEAYRCGRRRCSSSSESSIS